MIERWVLSSLNQKYFVIRRNLQKIRTEEVSLWRNIFLNIFFLLFFKYFCLWELSLAFINFAIVCGQIVFFVSLFSKTFQKTYSAVSFISPIRKHGKPKNSTYFAVCIGACIGQSTLILVCTIYLFLIFFLSVLCYRR